MLIDISHHNTVDWSALPNGTDGVYLKITEGTAFVDPLWQAHYGNAGAKGLPRGAYHFADLGDPVAEADHFADVYASRSWELRPVLDIEKPGSTGAWISAFRDRFRQRTGHAAFRVYTGYSYITGVLNPAGWIDADTDLWIARYNTTLGWTHPQLVLWQYGQAGGLDADEPMNGWTPAKDQGGTDDMAVTDSLAAFGGTRPDGAPVMVGDALATAYVALSSASHDPGGKTLFDYVQGLDAKLDGLAVAIRATDTDVQTGSAAVDKDLQAGVAQLQAAIQANPGAPANPVAVATALEASGLPAQIVTALLAVLTKAAGSTP